MTVAPNVFPMRLGPVVLVVLLLLSCVGCWGSRQGGNGGDGVAALRTTDLSDPMLPRDGSGQAISLTGARNEWLGAAVHLSSWRGDRLARLRVAAVDGSAAIPAGAITVYQIVAVPVDTDRASLARQSGRVSGAGDVPRVLLSVPRVNGEFDLSQLRDPTIPPGAPHRAADGSRPVDLWIDVHVPAPTPPGAYRLSVDLLEKPRGRAVASLPLTIDVLDFVLPDERHLDLFGRLDFDRLAATFPTAFAGVNPRLMNRADARYRGAVATLDQLMTLAQAHRAGLFVPQVQPTVKWPSGEPPAIDWKDFDSLVEPWLTGNGFADRVPLGFWPVPPTDGLARFDVRSQQQYWNAAATHFEQRDWLERSAVVVDGDDDERASSADSLRLSTAAATVLRSHPRVRAMVPLEQDQVQFAAASNFGQMVRLDMTGRLMVTAPGAVASPLMQQWPRNAAPPVTWLRTDLAGLVPSDGGGTTGERDVRAWAWLAYLRQSRAVLWNDPLPDTLDFRRPVDPSDVVWFYPGQPFGRGEVVPTLALKWLRRAQQDYEYLYLAAQRGETINTRLLAELITKPVEVQPNQSPDPVYGLLGGTTDPAAWDGAMALVARSILLRQPGQLPDLGVQQQLHLETLRWLEPQQRPALMARSTQWMLDTLTPGGTNWVDLRVGVDIYSTVPETPARNALQWAGIGPGWRVGQQPVAVPSLAPYRIRRVNLDARVNLNELGAGTREPLAVDFAHGFHGNQSRFEFVAPAAVAYRRDRPAVVDGSLGDWREGDAIADGPLVKMLDRPSLQQQRLVRTAGGANVYTGWSDDNLYMAFRLPGVEETTGRPTKNFVDYQARRAWGEDLCEVLVQPVYADNSVGPLLNVTCKASGTVWVERKLDARVHFNPWEPLEGAKVLYAATVDDARVWRGEMAIPWTAVNDPTRGRPVLLRLNFSAHNRSTGESGSWAGPVDFGRDESFMGMVYLRDGE